MEHYKSCLCKAVLQAETQWKAWNFAACRSKISPSFSQYPIFLGKKSSLDNGALCFLSVPLPLPPAGQVPITGRFSVSSQSQFNQLNKLF